MGTPEFVDDGPESQVACEVGQSWAGRCLYPVGPATNQDHIEYAHPLGAETERKLKLASLWSFKEK